jgi:hypothetical protein
MCATASLADAAHLSTKQLDRRFLWHWATVTMVNLNEDHLKEIYKQVLSYLIPVWDEGVCKQVT